MTLFLSGAGATDCAAAVSAAAANANRSIAVLASNPVKRAREERERRGPSKVDEDMVFLYFRMRAPGLSRAHAVPLRDALFDLDRAAPS
jgi:hypothetical protein